MKQKFLRTFITVLMSIIFISCNSQNISKEARIIEDIKKTELYKILNDYPYFKYKQWTYEITQIDNLPNRADYMVSFKAFANYEIDEYDGFEYLSPGTSVVFNCQYDANNKNLWTLGGSSGRGITGQNIQVAVTDILMDKIYERIEKKQELPARFWEIIENGISTDKRKTFMQRHNDFEESVLNSLEIN